MNGLKVSINGELITIGMNKGKILLFFVSCEKSIYFTINGYSIDKKIVWYEADLFEDTDVFVKVEDVEELSSPISVKIKQNEKILSTYKILREKLLRLKLIDN